MNELVVAFLLAFAAVESAGNYAAVGDAGQAYGAYQFHRARWQECGGNPATFGRATAQEQDRVMRTALQRYERTRPAHIAPVVWYGNCHNVGHGRDRETAYVRKLRQALKSNP